MNLGALPAVEFRSFSARRLCASLCSDQPKQAEAVKELDPKKRAIAELLAVPNG
jgi:hypothetical protein